MKELRTLKKWVSDYEQAHLQLDDLEVLFDFFKEGEVEEKEVNDAYQNLLELHKQNSANSLCICTMAKVSSLQYSIKSK